MERYEEFEQYLRAAEPAPKERAGLWQTAIGLQKVDGLSVSEFLVDTATKHIEGEIDIETVQRMVKSYYLSANSREQDENDKEADIASSNIVKLLSEPSFTFSVEGFASIHRKIFHNVFKHAGEFREYDISKKEWVLNGRSVIYGPASDLIMTLRYDFDQEKRFRYRGLDKHETINHLADFISGLWQIHPFREGNTRTTAVFTIKYLRSLGFEVGNDMFKAHSWYFRNALVRANYRNIVDGIEATPRYLILFLRNLLLGETNELKNRYLHIAWRDNYTVRDSSQETASSSQEPDLSSQETAPGSQETAPGSQETALGSQETALNSQETMSSSQGIGIRSQETGVSNRERVIAYLQTHPTITLQEIADNIGITRRGVQKITDRLKAEGLLRREGATKAGKWIVLSCP